MLNSQGMPFGLTNQNFQDVKLSYTHYSAKTGAGKSEITMLGIGELILLEEAHTDDSEPAVVKGHLERNLLIRILDVMEDEHFLDLDDLYRKEADDLPQGTYELSLVLPNLTKKVLLEMPTAQSQFEHIVGAIRFAVSIALPEVLQKRFFARF